MTIAPTSYTHFVSCYFTPPPPRIHWERFDAQEVFCTDGLGKKSPSIQIGDTQISCCLPQEQQSTSCCGSYLTRQKFLESTFEAICKKYPKSTPIHLVSLGCDHLFMEYILASSLKEQGYTLFFVGIDPVYQHAKASHPDKEKQRHYQKLLQDFRKQLNLPQEHIHYLSDAKNLHKYLPPQAHVVLLESMPPYGHSFVLMEQKGLPSKPIEAFFGGGRPVAEEHANALCLFPTAYQESLREIFTHNCVIPCPFSIEDNGKEKYLDWGVKIASDGTYYISLEPPRLKTHLEEFLKKAIATIQQHRPRNTLSQEDITCILTKIQEFITEHKLPLDCHFSSDYGLARKEAKDTITACGAPGLCHLFTLRADATHGYAIEEKDIRLA